MAIVVGPTPWQASASIGYRALGSAVAGGYLICKSGGVAWIVAPASTEVSRNWFSRDDAVTTAQASAACGDWFVPTCSQLKNPGYCCRTHWDSYCSTPYWSSTDSTSNFAYRVNFSSGSAGANGKGTSYRVRAFRCVTY